MLCSLPAVEDITTPSQGDISFGNLVQRRLIMLALVALVPMALLAAGLAYFTLRHQQEETRDKALSRAREIMRDVDRELQSNLSMLEILAASPLLDEPEPDLERFHLLASRWLEQLPL